MTIVHRLEKLLSQANDLLNDTPNFSLRRDPSQSSYKLAAEIDQYFEEKQKHEPEAPEGSSR